ncbi:TetR/AcrR family transcriptional regulator [Glaciihabitans sp. UYNi722]|uniref:TetR/AcrR family transcriptional regulator n=1 Tax=Glaciihabitans sp. UYNi722 TaxID=3156344 RepID=UPI0033966AAF
MLAAAAAELLDQGGQSAVTIRAVAERCNVSHNAPYKHFTGRSDLLAAVAERDFGELRRLFEQESLGEAVNARAALSSALHQLAEYARAHEARYRLLFSDPDLSPNETLVAAAFGSFQAFRLLVSRYQLRLVQPAIDELQLAGLIYATTHGAIDLELSSRASDAKGLSRVETTITLLLDILEGLG